MSEKLGKYSTLFESNMIGVAATDFEDTIVDANDAFLSMIGYTQEDLKNGSIQWSTISPSRYQEIDMQKIHELAEFQRIVPFQKEYIHKNGHSVPVIVGAEIIDSEKKLGICFAIDVSDLKVHERKKDDFIGLVSHELKTPLAIMKLSTDLLLLSLEKKLSKNDLVEFATEISDQIERLNILITDLINMARYEGEQESIFQRREIDVVDCVKKAVEDITLLSKRNITLTIDKNLYVYGNMERLKQVFINIIGNAIRYSSSDTAIHVRVLRHDSEHAVCVEIEDSGTGIEESIVDKIFDRFYRIENPQNYTVKGGGIGLYISNQIVNFHRGTIKVRSNPGAGSTFYVELPLSKQGI